MGQDGDGGGVGRGGIQSHRVKFDAQIRRGTVYGRGPTGSVGSGRAFGGGRRLGQRQGNAGGACRSRTWATEVGGKKKIQNKSET